MKNLFAIITLCLIAFCISCSQKNKGDDRSGDLINQELKVEDEASIILRATELYENNQYEDALLITNKGIELYGLTGKLIDTKYKILLPLKEYEEALEVFELIIAREGDSPDIVIDKIRLLLNLERIDEALAVALSSEEKSDGTSPYSSLIIGRIYLKKNDKKNAISWLVKTNERGFIDFDYLLSEEFELLHSEKDFESLINQMKELAGIGLPAKDFSISQYSGEEYNLSNDKGKVILLDFWATWCPPCVAEYPNLKSLYEKYGMQGFEIVSISADSKKESLQRYLERNEINWINGFSGKGRNDDVVNLYKIDSYPTYIIIDRKGNINYVTSYGGDKLNKIVSDLMSD